MLAQVLGAERERFLLGEKNTYIIEGKLARRGKNGGPSGRP